MEVISFGFVDDWDGRELEEVASSPDAGTNSCSGLNFPASLRRLGSGPSGDGSAANTDCRALP